MHTGPPDFVGVGTNKSGTTWWHRLLSLHPDVYLEPGRPKELHHFDRHWSEPFAEDDVDRYHDRFARPAGRRCGEWTPRYSADVWVPPLLHRAAPDAKWLVLLRDPWDRFVSEISWSSARLGSNGSARLVDMALARSRYAEQLGRLRSAHPAEQILVLQYESCCREPEAMLHRTQQFIGLEPWSPPAEELRRPVNASLEPPQVLPDVLRKGFLDTIRPDLDALLSAAAEFGLDPGLWPSAADQRET